DPGSRDLRASRPTVRRRDSCPDPYRAHRRARHPYPRRDRLEGSYAAHLALARLTCQEDLLGQTPFHDLAVQLGSIERPPLVVPGHAARLGVTDDAPSP